MRKVIQKNTLITGEGKAFPYKVIVDSADAGVVCKAADGNVIVLQHSDIDTVISYSVKAPSDKPAETPTTDKPVKTDK